MLKNKIISSALTKSPNKPETAWKAFIWMNTDALVSLRLSGKERVWGILQENALLLLWWDPGHEICPSILD